MSGPEDTDTAETGGAERAWGGPDREEDEARQQGRRQKPVATSDKIGHSVTGSGKSAEKRMDLPDTPESRDCSARAGPWRLGERREARTLRGRSAPPSTQAPTKREWR